MNYFNTIITYIIEAGFSIGLIVNAFLFIPQALAIYKTKNSNSVSVTTFLGFNVIQGFTISHAYLVHDYMLFFGMFASFLTCASVTGLSLWYRWFSFNIKN